MANNGLGLDMNILGKIGILPNITIKYTENQDSKNSKTYSVSLPYANNFTQYGLRTVPEDELKPENLYTLTFPFGLPFTAAGGQLVSTRNGYQPVESLSVGDTVHMYFGPIDVNSIPHDFERFSYFYGLSYGQLRIRSPFETNCEYPTALSVPLSILKDTVDTVKLVANKTIEYWHTVMYDSDQDNPGNMLVWVNFQMPRESSNFPVNRLFNHSYRVLCDTGVSSIKADYSFSDPHQKFEYSLPKGEPEYFLRIPEYLVTAPDDKHTAGREAFIRGLFREGYKPGPFEKGELEGRVFYSDDKTNLERLLIGLHLCGRASVIEDDYSENAPASKRLRILKANEIPFTYTQNASVYNVPIQSIEVKVYDDMKKSVKVWDPGVDSSIEFFSNFIKTKSF